MRDRLTEINYGGNVYADAYANWLKKNHGSLFNKLSTTAEETPSEE
ncbi:MAG TPA: hypothetical protein VKC17_06995 [Sphingomicrobium sp.]|nr:hypothetical protein [Sphingomicrobium sp.]